MSKILLTLDPATGSGSSKPGFAVWTLPTWLEGVPVLLDCGTLPIRVTQLRPGEPDNTGCIMHWRRMQALSNELPEKLSATLTVQGLQHIDKVVVEGLAPVIGAPGASGGRGGISGRSTVHLHHAVAVMLTCYPWSSIEELSVATWKSFLNHMGISDKYVKGDMNDALIIGLTWMCAKGYSIPTIPPQVLNGMGLIHKHTGLSVLNPELWHAWAVHITQVWETAAKTKDTKARKKHEARANAKAPTPQPPSPVSIGACKATGVRRVR